jgi:ketosteroid isomerase-like protein
MTKEQMHAFAVEWITAWNRRDIGAVLHPFTDDAQFLSPRAREVTGRPLVVGKAALEDYWRRALARIGTMVFRLDHVVADPGNREMVVVYDRLIDGKSIRACEIMRFDSGGKQIWGEALYGAAI